ncbi:nucleotidyltransferase family protein [Dethiosulfovibrio sp. F2B]|uniref:tRNA(Met) cytidine acetate ligase n=1 Tax=Dethiosulfovibrio faecalis TaxID=2720018 RepID=UPI001F2C4B18|nr:nucleotidyltransferase family protein [Dethiosulfovibrio faecalis]MCF4150337.1 nucleotidyltransferase family protein [Dethiosulfovibrio faecalis]
MCKKAIGIIAEYNPFHMGHLHHVEKASSSGDPVVVVLSSNFTQRGEPAFIDKWSRAEMALHSGADLVLELPVVFSCHNAGVFANAGVDIIESTGVIDRISFGMETLAPEFQDIVAILVEEPKPFKLNLHEFLNEGFSYVESRARAVDFLLPGAGEILSQPNNSLAISYMMRIKEKGYDIAPLPIKRIGGEYHDRSISVEFPSATAIRKAIRGKEEKAFQRVPPFCSKILKREISRGRCFLDKDTLWEKIRFLLTRTSSEELGKYAEFGEGIENRFIKAFGKSTGWDDFIDRCTSRRYPRGRLQRNMIHFLVGLRHEENRAYQEKGPAYLRALGATKRGRDLLKRIDKVGTLPVISKFAQLDRDYGKSMLSMERRSCDIWELLLPGGAPGKDAITPPIIV